MAYYLAGINVLSFLLHAIHTRRYADRKAGWIRTLFTVAVLAGGSPGALLAILLLDRKAEKRNMMALVLAVCALIVQVVLLLFCSGAHRQELTFDVGGFFGQHRWLVLYLAAINLAACAAFAIDKFRAVRHLSRIRIVTLLLLAFLGGTVGALLAMYVFRHKTNKDYFAVGVPMILVTHLVLLFYAMNA